MGPLSRLCATANGALHSCKHEQAQSAQKSEQSCFQVWSLKEVSIFQLERDTRQQTVVNFWCYHTYAVRHSNWSTYVPAVHLTLTGVGVLNSKTHFRRLRSAFELIFTLRTWRFWHLGSRNICNTENFATSHHSNVTARYYLTVPCRIAGCQMN